MTSVMRQSSAKSMGSRPVSCSSRPSIEYYMRPESRMSSIPKVKQEAEETRAQYAWRIIRQCVREAIDLSLKADIKDMVINHGMHHVKKVLHIDPIQQMLYNKNTNEYITVDGKVLRIFHPDGRKKEVVTPPEPFNRLMYAASINLYVGWTMKQNTLVLMNDEFEIQSKSEGVGPFLSAVYNENIGEVVTTGPGFLTSWVFRYGGRHILPRKTCTEGLTEKDQFQLIVLEETISRSQKAYAACGSAVAVFNLFHGQLLDYKKELHVRNITALLFFNPLKYLITAARDGSIKVWDEKWHLQLVFVGHYGPVTSLAIHPFGPNIVSASTDNTIRVWSLETCDEVDVCETGDPVSNLGTMVNNDKFFSHSNNHADLWKVQHIHMLHTRVGHRVLKMKCTDHPEHAIRNLLMCKDASVRITSPVSGEVLTTLLQSPRKVLIDAAYAIEENKMFTCYQNGDIIKSDTSTNPCTVIAEWKCRDQRKACNYLLVYEYVITADVGSDMWGGIKRIAAAKGKLETGSSSANTPTGSNRSTPMPTSAPPETPGKQNANRTLLLGGRKDGHICVFNMDTGDTEFEIEAHGTFGVLSMIANSKADQLISAGLDNLIKIWRLYPYAQESLAPLMTLYCAHTPIFMCILKSKLAVAFQEHSTATYSVVMYSLKGRNRFDHPPDNDHMDSIVGLSSCPKLKLVASASHDGTIKIWNELNNLVRIIRLNAKPHSVTFCGEKGDLMVGIGDHAHKIDYKKYMPKAYRLKMISISFSEQPSEKALSFDENLVNMLSKEDQKRLKAARSSFKFTHFVDILTEEESEEVMKERNMRDAAFNALAKRDEELLKIKEGEVSASRKPKSTPATKNEAFEKYLKIFYNRPKVPTVIDDLFPEDHAQEILKGEKKKMDAPWKPEKEPTGFFPPSTAGTTKKSREPTKLTVPEIKPTTPATPIRPDGYIPNSVLVHLLFPKEKSTLSEPAQEEWKLKKITKEQMEQIETLKKKHKGPESLLAEPHDDEHSVHDDLEYTEIKPKKKKFAKEGTERTLVLDYSDDEDTKHKEEEEEEVEEPKEPSAFLSKMQSLMEKSATPPPTPPSEEALGTEYSDTSFKSGMLESVQKQRTWDDYAPLPKTVSFIEPELLEFQDNIYTTKPKSKTKPPDGDAGDLQGIPIDPVTKEASVASTGTTPRAPVSQLPKPVSKPGKPFVRYVSTYKAAPHPPGAPKPESAGSTRATESSIASRPHSPPQRPKTPLPDFISQFKGLEWFDKYFPNANENTFPKPWNVNAFITMIVRVLRIADFKLKVDVVDALLTLHMQEGITNHEPIYKVMYSIYNHHTHPPSCMNEEEKAFIRKGLELLQLLGVHDRDFYIELIVQFLEGDKDVRAQVMENLQICGLKDPHKYFVKELDSWDVWNLDEKDRQGELRRMCKDWLERWMTSFKIHLQDTIDRLKRGQSVVGRATPSQMRTSPAPPPTNKGILKKPALPGLAEEGDEEESNVPGTPSVKGPISVTFDKPPDASSIENATFIEAINYFCDMELEKYVDQIKSGGRPMEKGAEDKNTVLVLPKIAGLKFEFNIFEIQSNKDKCDRSSSIDNRHTNHNQYYDGQLPAVIRIPTEGDIPMDEADSDCKVRWMWENVSNASAQSCPSSSTSNGRKLPFQAVRVVRKTDTGKATLVRLGETHTSKCRPARETSLSVDLKLPPITSRGKQPPPGQLYGFPSCIQLPMKPVMMNPFPGGMDQYDPVYTVQQPVLLMLKTSQKYFVHDRSYVPPDMFGEV